MRKFLLLLLAVALVLIIASVSFAADTETVNGWISDSKCGAKGANASAEACTKKCIAAGASPVIVTDKDEKVLTVENPDALKEHYGHHVAVTGHIDGDKIHVDSVKML
jgi:putative cell wall-binding protein